MVRRGDALHVATQIEAGVVRALDLDQRQLGLSSREQDHRVSRARCWECLSRLELDEPAHEFHPLGIAVRDHDDDAHGTLHVLKQSVAKTPCGTGSRTFGQGWVS
jgi:hypothetical protein